MICRWADVIPTGRSVIGIETAALAKDLGYTSFWTLCAVGYRIAEAGARVRGERDCFGYLAR